MTPRSAFTLRRLGRADPLLHGDALFFSLEHLALAGLAPALDVVFEQTVTDPRAFTEPVGLVPDRDVSFSIGTLGTGRLILPSNFDDDPKLTTSSMTITISAQLTTGM